MTGSAQKGQANGLISRDDTKMMKGLAIVLMLCHHLWSFPNKIAGGELKYLFTIFDHSAVVYIGMFSKICVALFFFLGGYGTYLSCQGRRYDLVGRLKRLYVSYWKVFVIFIPIAFLFFSKQGIYCAQEDLCTRYASFTWQECIGNFLGVRTSYNEEWWFLFSYAVALLTFPFIRSVIRKHSPGVDLFIVVVVSILLTNAFWSLGNVEALGTVNNNYLYSRLFRQIPFAASFWMGVVAAKDGLLDRLSEGLRENRQLNPAVDVLVWLAVIYLRQTGIGGEQMDVFYAPVLVVVSVDLFGRTKYVKKALLALGRQSTNMWLIHSFFCYYFGAVVKLVVAPKWAVPSLAFLIVLTYLASLGVTYLWKGVARLVERGK